MNFLYEFALGGAILAAVTSSLAIVLNDRRLIVGMLAGEYFALAWLTALVLPVQMSAVKLLAGLMACGALAIAAVPRRKQRPEAWHWFIPSSRLFRLLAVAIVLVFSWGVTRLGWTPVPNLPVESSFGFLFLIGAGLLHIGISEEPLRVGIGLLTMLAGFEIAYSAIEPSLAVMALLGALHLGISIVVSYLMTSVGGEIPAKGAP
jgi:hypothetical protein